VFVLPNNDGAVDVAAFEPKRLDPVDGLVVFPKRPGAEEVAVLDPNKLGAVDVAVLDPNMLGAVDVAVVLDPNKDGWEVFVPNPPVCCCCCVLPNKPVEFAVVVLLPNPKLDAVEVAGGAALAPNPKLGVVDVGGAAELALLPNENALDAGAVLLDPKDPPVLVPKPPPKGDAVDAAGFDPKVNAITTPE
jgi:hypothetical protein